MFNKPTDENQLENLIEIQDLTWWYPDSPSLTFNHLNFNLMKWDFVFLVWESWVGKTTLVKFLTRQLTPPKKTIFFKKEDIARFDSDEVQNYRRNIWVIYQDYKLLDWRSTYDNLIVPLHIAWKSPLSHTDTIESYLKLVWLNTKKDLPVEFLSWWEKQRVAIARALMSHPQFIIADEPTWNLDRNNTVLVADTLISLHHEWHTIIFITHDQKLIDYIQTKTQTSLFTLK